LEAFLERPVPELLAHVGRELSERAGSERNDVLRAQVLARLLLRDLVPGGGSFLV
jgi:hypothetical protein